MQLLQARLGRPLEDVVTDLYITKGMTLAEVATELEVGESTLSRWLTQLGIEARRPGSRRPEVAV